MNQAYHYLVGNRAALPAVVWSMVVVGGFRYANHRFVVSKRTYSKPKSQSNQLPIRIDGINWHTLKRNED